VQESDLSIQLSTICGAQQLVVRIVFRTRPNGARRQAIAFIRYCRCLFGSRADEAKRVDTPDIRHARLTKAAKHSQPELERGV
jgi:hypothetical protein